MEGYLPAGRQGLLLDTRKGEHLPYWAAPKRLLIQLNTG